MSERATHCDRHPIECEIIDDDGATVCGWCQEAHNLTEEAKQLRDQLQKTAVLCYGGEVNIYGDIGYAVVYRGTINTRYPLVMTLPHGLPGECRCCDSIRDTMRPEFSKLPSGD